MRKLVSHISTPATISSVRVRGAVVQQIVGKRAQREDVGGAHERGQPERDPSPARGARAASCLGVATNMPISSAASSAGTSQWGRSSAAWAAPAAARSPRAPSAVPATAIRRFRAAGRDDRSGRAPGLASCRGASRILRILRGVWGAGRGASRVLRGAWGIPGPRRHTLRPGSDFTGRGSDPTARFGPHWTRLGPHGLARRYPGSDRLWESRTPSTSSSWPRSSCSCSGRGGCPKSRARWAKASASSATR